MFQIKRVEIDGFWGSYKLKTDLDDDINIFIGSNGSGKTTFINFLEATLTGDISLLETLEFNEIRFWLLDNTKKTKKVTISRIPVDTGEDKIRYQIGRVPFQVPLMSKEDEYRRRRLFPKQLEQITILRQYLAELVNISWISVHRELLEDEYRDPHSMRQSIEKNPIDRRIDDITKRFTQYQLQLQSQINILSETFRKEVLESMLYNSEFDQFTVIQEGMYDLQVVKNGLLQAYKELKILDSGVHKKIDEHINILEKSIKEVSKSIKEKKGLTVNSVLPLSLLKRTQHIIGLSSKMEVEKRVISNNVDTYLKTLQSFANDKSFQMSPDHSGELLIKKTDTILPMEQLSSGEKQLFILLTEALLQRNQSSIFIADEPELSLHIKWQRLILSAIKTINPNSQVIAATHSPEIAGHYRSKIIKMEDIIYA